MNTSNTSNEELVTQLQNQNRALKRLITALSRIAIKSADSELDLVYSMEGSIDGVWDWNAVTNEVVYSSRWKEIPGFEDTEIENDLSEWEKRVHPDDRPSVGVDLNAHLNDEVPYYQNEHRIRCKDGHYKWVLDRGRTISWTESGKPLRVIGTHSDVTSRKETELENLRLVTKLHATLDSVKLLSGLLPICASCKKIRDKKGDWTKLESYIRDNSEVEFTHGYCPACAGKIIRDLHENENLPGH